MRFIFCATAALAMTCSCAFAYADGTILLTRTVDVVSNGMVVPVGSGLFSVDDRGGHLQQLTPSASGLYFMPSWLASQPTGIGEGWWLTTNLSPNGQSLLYFRDPSSDPSAGVFSGKYYVKNLDTGRIQPLFAGSNDIAAPGYGYLAMNPANGNLIAFANSTSEYSVSAPCVYQMHADGSKQRVLWCAPATLSMPGASSPVYSQAIGSLRWSGNGRKLMVYVSYQPPSVDVAKKHTQDAQHTPTSMFAFMPHKAANPLAATPAPADRPVEGGTGFSALFIVDVATGTAVEIGTNMFDPAMGDISYDGSKVIYEQYDDARCGDEKTVYNVGTSLCFKDLITGKVTDLLPPTMWATWGGRVGPINWWSQSFYPQVRLSPDSSRAVFTLQTTGGNEADLYTVRTDGTYLHQLTRNPNPSSDYTAWTPVKWSSDGTRILANRTAFEGSQIHFITVSDGDDKFVTNGYAVQWLERP
jgi:hypothetical protein